jgi:methionyl-tRNA formyltransferase
MGTPDFAVPSLQTLLDSDAYEVVAACTQPDRPAGRGRRAKASAVKQVAKERGVEVLQPSSLKRDEEAVAALAELQPDVIVVAAYGLILPPAVLELPSAGSINVHASLLPRWRGAAPVTYALLAGDEVTGATIMLMDEGLDTGPILAQREIPVRPDDTSGTLTQRLARLGAELLSETLPLWLAGEIAPREQPDVGVTLAPRLAREEGRLMWSDDAIDLARRVRALHPWPGAFTTLPDGRRMKVHQASALDGSEVQVRYGPNVGQSSQDPAPGHVVALDGVPAVVCGSGLLRLDVVQPEGKRQMEGAAFLRGVPSLVGASLGESAGEK